MKIKLFPSVLKGTVKIPPSKSISHRAIIAAALSGGTSKISNLIFSDDIKATISALKNIGADFTVLSDSLIVKGISFTPPNAVINCGESGSTLRFIIPIAAALGIESEFTGKGRLPIRPLTPYINEFPKKNINILKYDNNMLPLKISGKLTGGKYNVDGNISSQFITGLLFALPLLETDSRIEIIGRLESKPYVDITISVLKSFGIEIDEIPSGYFIRGGQKYHPSDYTIEGDYSQAAFFLTASCIGNNEISCKGLSVNTTQGDREIIDILKKCGCRVDVSVNNITVHRPHVLTAFDADVSDIPDLVPILAVLASLCSGTSKMLNAERLRIKESDRIMSTAAMLDNLGVKTHQAYDSLTVIGAEKIQGGYVSSFNDHRIAMACSVMASAAGEPIILDGAEAVNKSFPSFFDIYKNIGGKFNVIDME